ncbi:MULTISPECIES: hypothetical protein [unclassified Pseudoalteromonas]|uniref:hypothetical protein n=1 Tax=unclassified Pseudoalteromonas TaxID=194690 RepID=UPI00390C5132
MEIDDWTTPFGKGDLFIINTKWGASERSIEYANGKRYEFKNEFQSGSADLIVTVFHTDSEIVFEITFDNVGGYRLLDEHGLTELWESGEINNNCFKVRDHGWSKESPLSFFMHTNDGWSYLISTADECAEVISTKEPKIVFKQKVTATYT